jgi:hypothetical protein
MKWRVPGFALAILTLCMVISFGQAFAESALPETWTYNPQEPNAPCPSMPSCGTWVRFRKAHPWPYQAFALDEGTAEKVVIISEPPLVFTHDGLQKLLNALFGANLLSVDYNRWPTGLDGWLEDVVLRVRNVDQSQIDVLSGTNFEKWKAPAEIVDRLRLLHQFFYGTSRGFWVDRIISEISARRLIPDLRIPVSDLSGWLDDEKTLWSSADGVGDGRSTRELYAENIPGVFRSGAMVAIVVPRGVRFDDLEPHFRRFATASDLLIGASRTNAGGLLLFARLRQLPLGVLPPLRIETVARFAASPGEHLAQSYERQRIFAGRLKTGQYASWDWAPILLSPQLDDSEFGTLLNLADQILKSWSQHGQVDYFGFAYPRPESFPFGDVAASEYFAQRFRTTSLLFNWNTDGVATITTVNGRDILTNDRTGALPILYMPSDGTGEVGAKRGSVRSPMQQDADRRAASARDYFSELGDPILVRVVQNVLLCQALQSFLLSDSPQTTGLSRSDQVADVLQKRAAAWLAEMAKGKTQADREINSIVMQFMRKRGLTTDQMARILGSPQSVERDLQQRVERLRVSAAEEEWISSYLRNASRNANALFFGTCDRVGGHIETDASGQTKCAWTSIAGTSGEWVFFSYHAYLTGIEQLQARQKQIAASFDGEQRELVRLSETYAKAAEVAQKVSERVSDTDLENVLRDVLEVTSRMPVRGSIRTPSVVLSKNSVDVRSIGGHNIDLIPRRRLVAPAAGLNLLSELPPPRPQVESLKVDPAGSLLDEMLTSADNAGLPPQRAEELKARAARLHCDALVVQGERGIIYVVKNGAEPRAVFGKSGLIDALAGPRAARLVRFENFPDSTVDNIARTAALMRVSTRQTGFGSAIDGIGALLGDRRVERKASLIIQRERGLETLALREESGIASFSEPIPTNSSSITSPTPVQWALLFGKEPKLVNSQALVVRFGDGRGHFTSLGIRLKAGEKGDTVTPVGLRRIVSGWLKSEPTKPIPWPEQIIELREKIREELKNPDLDLEFYYRNHNKGKVRAADADWPKRCEELGCAA